LIAFFPGLRNVELVHAFSQALGEILLTLPEDVVGEEFFEKILASFGKTARREETESEFEGEKREMMIECGVENSSEIGSALHEAEIREDQSRSQRAVRELTEEAAC
jgi:hypothetical protein